jgi:hypothetical protein
VDIDTIVARPRVGWGLGPRRGTLRAVADTSKIAKNLRAFQIAVNAHDRENPTHDAYGIGLAPFDLERLGFDEGEEVLPGITIHADGGVTGNFRVLCDGDHDAELEEEETEVVEAVSTQPALAPMIAPGRGDPDDR